MAFDYIISGGLVYDGTGAGPVKAYPDGIVHVLVNGLASVRSGTYQKGMLGGRVLTA